MYSDSSSRSRSPSPSRQPNEIGDAKAALNPDNKTGENDQLLGDGTGGEGVNMLPTNSLQAVVIGADDSSSSDSVEVLVGDPGSDEAEDQLSDSRSDDREAGRERVKLCKFALGAAAWCGSAILGATSVGIGVLASGGTSTGIVVGGVVGTMAGPAMFLTVRVLMDKKVIKLL